MAAGSLEALLKRDRLLVLASLAALTALAWAYLFHLASVMPEMGGSGMDGMAGMDMPGMEMGTSAAANPAGAILLTTLMWFVMMTGMMLPSAAPTILLFAAVERKRPLLAGGRVTLFGTGYLLVWGLFSIAAATAQTLLAAAGLLGDDMALTAAIGGGLFLLAGLYELTPIKQRCLAHCRSPLEWIPRHWRAGRLGAVRMGAEHGVTCLGCCWVLMLILFAVGVMNLLWVAILAAIVLAQKLLPAGPLLSRLGGLVLIGWGTLLLTRAGLPS